MHQHSFSQGLSSFFERLPHRFRADALHYLAFDQPVGQQFQRPTGPAFRWFSAGQGNQVGFPLTVQPLRTTIELPLSLQGRLNPFLHATAAHPLHRRAANLENPGNLFILHGPLRMGLITQQQDAPVGLLVSRRPATGHQCLQFLPLLRTQLDPVSLHRHSPLPRPNPLRPMLGRIHLISTQFKNVGLLATDTNFGVSPDPPKG